MCKSNRYPLDDATTCRLTHSTNVTHSTLQQFNNNNLKIIIIIVNQKIITIKQDTECKHLNKTFQQRMNVYSFTRPVGILIPGAHR
jgi:hypothetical protein